MDANTPSESLDTRERLIVAAAREFAEHGYEGASLRQICGAAGVTTGALYFFFKNKEDLFRTVIQPVVGPMEATFAERGEGSIVQVLSRDNEEYVVCGSLDLSADLLELCYEKRSVVEIVVKNRDNPIVESVLAELRRSFEETIRWHFERTQSDPEVWDDLVVRWLADVALDSMIEILELDSELEDARRHMRSVFSFIRGGVRALRRQKSAGVRTDA